LQSRWQLWQLISEARMAVSGAGFMGVYPMSSIRYADQVLLMMLLG
jgi:hypothetical protein